MKDLERLWKEFLATGPMNMDFVQLITEKDQDFEVQDRAWEALRRSHPTGSELCRVIAGASRFRVASWRELKALDYDEPSFTYAINFLAGSDRDEACGAILANDPSDEALLCLLSHGSEDCSPRAWAELLARKPSAAFLIDSLNRFGKYKTQAGTVVLCSEPTIEQLLTLMVEVPELKLPAASSLLRLKLRPCELVRIYKYVPEYRWEVWRRIKEHGWVTNADLREVFSVTVADNLPVHLTVAQLILDRANDNHGIALVARFASVLRDEAWDLLSRRRLDQSLVIELMDVPELKSRVAVYSQARASVGMAMARLTKGVSR